jgi:ubiquinone/menaquinone biosynthesis C-methylase UbiE
METAIKTNNNHSATVKFQTANAVKLPYTNESFDACILQAVLTTITVKEDRIKVLSEANRVLKENGTLYLADFGQNWENPRYSERYLYDYHLTGEMGTFIVTEDGKQDGKELFKAHHYTHNELIELVGEDFKVETFHETVFTTFHGNRTKGYIIIASKL